MIESTITSIFQTANLLILVTAGVFARIGAILFLLPGFGERAMSIRLRLVVALLLALLLAPLIEALGSQRPNGLAAFVHLLLAEAVIGLVLGLAFRLLVWALQIAGMTAAQHISIAQMFGAGVSPEPEPTIATLLSFGGIAIALSLGLHIEIVGILARSYDTFPFGVFPAGRELGDWTTARISETFAFGIMLAAPFVAVGFAYNLALGALNRAMPQLLVALVGVPFLVWIGLAILFLILPALFSAWMAQLLEVMNDPLGGLR